MRHTTIFLLIMIGLIASPMVSASDPEQPERVAYGKYTPTEITKSRLRGLFDALTTYRETFASMPDSVNELVDLGYISSSSDLVDARHPILTQEPMRNAPPDRIDRFRIVSQWREGAIATTDLPHGGEWIILNSDGSIDIRPVDPVWLGRYTPKPVADTELESFLQHPASRLGAVISTGSTNSGRKGLGVDRIIPGFSRNRVDFRPDADLLPGDLILSVDGQHFDSLEAYAEHAEANPPVTFSAWKRPILEIIRDGELMTVCALNINGNFPSTKTSEGVYKTAKVCMSETGPGAIRVNRETSDNAGIRIKAATTDHTAEYLQPGDILLRVNDEPVISYLPSFYPEQAGSTVELTVERDGEIIQIPFPLDRVYPLSKSHALDEIEMGILDLDAVRNRRKPNPEHVGIHLWIMGLHQTQGPEAAAREAERLYNELPEHDTQFRFRRFKAWVDQLQRAKRYPDAIALIDRGLVWFPDPSDQAECMVLRTKLIVLSGRVDDAVRYTKTIPIDDERYMQAGFDATQAIMNAGYPDAVLDIARVYLQSAPDNEDLQAGVEMLEEHIRNLEKSMKSE